VSLSCSHAASMETTQPLPAAILRRIAVRSSTDPRTVLREWRSPGSVKGMSGDRIRRALAELGYATTQPVALTHAVAGLEARR
jgi:hypothetical protein